MAHSQMREVFLTAEIFNAEYAHRSGLVHFVGDSQACENYLQNKILHILKCGPKAVLETKKLLNALPNMNTTRRKNYTTQMIASVRVSPEGQEGLKSFLEKRKPKWLK
jgi:methylglutaconyl-CoA hydratase